MTTPPVFCASSSASADLPLAVGPAISTALLKPSEFACMSLVATLICNPANPALDSTIVDGALAVLPSPGTAAMAVRRGRGRYPLYRQRGYQGHRGPPARGARRPADRHCRAACRVPAQEAFSRRHGFHHDRPGMHRRTGRFRRAEGACRRHHRTRDARRDRVRAGAARARRAAEGPAGRRGRRSPAKAHHADAGRPRAGHDHARPWRLYLPDLGRLYAVHQRGRRDDRVSGKPRQRIDGPRRQAHRRGRASRSSAAPPNSPR